MITVGEMNCLTVILLLIRKMKLTKQKTVSEVCIETTNPDIYLKKKKQKKTTPADRL